MNHKTLSIQKSIIRILALGWLFFGYFAVASIFLIVAELIGILEELV